MVTGLPTASITISCGVCGASLDHDGDVLVCWDCGLDYSAEDPEGAPATYRDEDATPCGRPHPHPTVHDSKPYRTMTHQGKTTVLAWRDWTHTRAPCTLPSTHTGLHHNPVTSTYTERTA